MTHGSGRAPAAEHYIEAEGLNQLLSPAAWTDSGTPADPADETAIPPSWGDLVRLHRLVRTRKPATVLEFGVGFSTLVIADALEKNERDAAGTPPPRKQRRYPFQLFSVDASQYWLDRARRRLPERFAARVHFHFSPVSVATHAGQFCHRYDTLPDIVPDLVYLDGPSPADVSGSLHGLSFQCTDRTVMAADLLLMESTFLPGTFILVDGRTNNARFLQRSFQRRYDVVWDREADVTTFELIEEPLFGGSA